MIFGKSNLSNHISPVKNEQLSLLLLHRNIKHGGDIHVYSFKCPTLYIDNFINKYNVCIYI